jgi:hypothetical protein
MALDGNEHVAVAKVRIVLGTNAFLFFPDEAPNLVRFYVSYFDVAYFFGHDAFALLTNSHQQLQDRGVMNFGGAFDARNGVAFEQETENHFGLLDRQVHAVQSLVAGIRENLAALGALVALAVLAFTEFAAFCPTIVASHGEISC